VNQQPAPAASVKAAPVDNRSLFETLAASPVPRSAFRALLFNLASSALLLLGNAYAARSLGPTNLGVGAQVLAMVQQASLAFNGGLDHVAVRLIAAHQEPPAAVARSVLSFRFVMAVALACVWSVIALLVLPPGAVRAAWLMGAVLLVVTSLQLPFLFQAVEQMPRFAAFSAMSSLLVAVTYWLTFHPGMPAGSDLVVMACVGVFSASVIVALSFRMVNLPYRTLLTGWSDSIALLRRLLAQSWRYWILAVLIFIYSVLPVLLVGHLRGDAAAGILRIGLVLAGGLELLFSSINSLLLPRLVQWHQEGNDVLRARQGQLLKTHVTLGLAVAVVTLLAAPWVFRRFLGPEFLPGLAPFLVLAMARVVVFVGQIYAWTLVALRLDAQLLYATCCGAAISLLLNLLLIPRFGVMGAAYASLVAEVVIVSLAFLWQRQHVRS
jgi:O-antigen/teichoic acid export membrane protein